jgi:hypothetical protein
MSDMSERADTEALPWYRAHPRGTVAVATALFAAVFALRLSAGDPDDAVNLLLTLPIALLALAFGRTVGLVSGAVGVALVAAWVVIRDVDLSALGWASRATPLLLLGGLLGDASDRLTAAQARHRALEAAAQRHRDATEVNDTLVQGMAAARWSLEAGRYDAGLKTLEETLVLGHQLVSRLMREADMGMDGHRPPARDNQS